MALEKLTIRVVDDGTEFEVLFNPNQISIQKATKWSKVPTAESDTSAAQFTHGEPAALSLELFFDTYEAGTDVSDHTRKIFHLTTIEKHGDLHRPPICQLHWGRYTFDDFQWVLVRLDQKFTLFLADGTPVRATLGCSFQQWRSDEVEAKLLDKQSADVVKTRVVRRGDTLSGIAAEAYKDPALWRSIASANHIANPRLLEPGLTLTLPKVRTGRRRRRS